MSSGLLSADLMMPPGFLFGGTGTGEIVLIFVVILLLFGPRRLPEIARMIGRIITQLRNASDDFRHQIMRIEEEDADTKPVINVTEEPLEDQVEQAAQDKEPAVSSKEDGAGR